MQWFGDSCWKNTLFRTKRWVYETVEHAHPVSKQSTGGPLLYYFNGWAPSLLFQRVGPYFIISTDGAPSLLFQQVGPFFIISTGGWGPSSLFQRVGPFYYYNLHGPLLYYFNWWARAPSLLFQGMHWDAHLLSPFVGYWSIVINFRFNYSQIAHFQV